MIKILPVFVFRELARDLILLILHKAYDTRYNIHLTSSKILVT